MTYRCGPCDVNWHPYQTAKGACPVCGGGTRRVHEPASRRAAFEEFCKRRDSEALKRTLREIDALPVAEPDRRLAA